MDTTDLRTQMFLHSAKNVERVKSLFPELYARGSNCPKCGKRTKHLRSLIPHLNDFHHSSFSEIADILDEINAQPL